jgi:cation diffusion facilitator family transporter
VAVAVVEWQPAPEWSICNTFADMPSQPSPAEDESALTVLVALAVNLAVAAAKLVAGLVSRSSAMLAEALHAFADTGNEILLLIAQRRSQRPADFEHPLGHGREAYFWALIASLAVFVTGASLSVRQGIRELLQPAKADSFTLAYAVLGVSLVLESFSLWRAYQQLREEASQLSREFLEHFDLNSDPITRAIFAEDAAAVLGNVIAGIGIALHQLTGSPIPDALAAIVIGVVLGYVAVQLARRNGDFLVGRRASKEIEDRIRDQLARQPGVLAIDELLVTFLGPRRLWVIGRVEIDETLTGTGVKQLLGALERALTGGSRFVARVDIVPARRAVGRAAIPGRSDIGANPSG